SGKPGCSSATDVAGVRPSEGGDTHADANSVRTISKMNPADVVEPDEELRNFPQPSFVIAPDDEAMERSFGQMLSHVSKKKLCFGWPRNAIKEEKLLDKASDRADAYAATLSTSVILSNTDRKNSANVITRVGRAPAIHVSQAGNSLRAETRPSTSRSNRT